MISHMGRTVVRLHPGSSCTIKFHVDFVLQRVSASPYAQLSQSSLFLPYSLNRRDYATKPVSRPKAHTGQTTSTRKRKPKATTPTTTAKKAKRERSADSKSTEVKAVPKKKTKKVKKALKPKAKPKTTKRKKKPVTEEEIAAAADEKRKKLIRSLKADALKPPKSLPATTLQLVIAESMAGKTGAGPELFKDAVAKYKGLVPEQIEHYNQIAIQNKKKNEEEYRKWVLTHSTADIAKANNARNYLKRLGITKAFHIKDDRYQPRPASAWALYLGERVLSGEYKSMSAAERTRLIASEYKEVSPAEKKKFEDLAAARKAEFVKRKATATA